MKTLKNLIFAALAATLLFQTPITRAGDRELGGRNRGIQNRFVILLSGVYEDVTMGHGPKGNLGLTTVNLSDGSYSKVGIYPVNGLPWDKDADKAIGTFYVQFVGSLCSYDLPGGSFSAEFTGSSFTMLPEMPVARESWTLDGTFELKILEATGIYRQFVGGHIHMVDILKFRGGNGTQLEDCFCHIHPKLVAP